MPRVKCSMKYCRSCSDGGLCTEESININWHTQCGSYLINRRKAKLCKHCAHYSITSPDYEESAIICLLGHEINESYERACWADQNPDGLPDIAKYGD